jgi:protein-tyrosine phosphatase
MQPSVYRIPLEGPGSLWIMPRPSAESMAEDIAAWCQMGMRKIISLLTVDEAANLGLSDEASCCAAQGLSFMHYSIPDRGMAENRAAFAILARDIAAELMAGAAVGIHCRAGIGRSGMLACCVLALSRLPADNAIARVSRARGMAVPDTDAQAHYIRGIADMVRRAPAANSDGTIAC